MKMHQAIICNLATTLSWLAHKIANKIHANYFMVNNISETRTRR